jgi:hypothetical protein
VPSTSRRVTCSSFAVVSARNAPQSLDLRCEIREKLLAFIRDEMPEAFPRDRLQMSSASGDFEALFGRTGALTGVRPAKAHNKDRRGREPMAPGPWMLLASQRPKRLRYQIDGLDIIK